ncbi:MAG: FAD-binding oxidoreductase [Chloroflexi bacterium]|nr:FAD-binding oxidoreductase [Chloroflexota bacterium]
MADSASRAKTDFPQKLAKIVGDGNVLTGEKATAPYTVDGITPQVVVYPASNGQVADIIKEANKSQITLVPWGSGSKQPVGPCLESADAVLCLKNMNQIAELDASNFSVQVQAGMVNAELQKQLAEQKLFFPLDPCFMETSTIGGEIATNANGPRRLMYGTVRDLVLGVTVVTPTGDIVHTGGKTMKNVAGLDLCRMFIGSRGTLGVIAEAVLRLFPLPEASVGIYAIFASPDDAFRLVGQLLNSPLTPSAIELADSVVGRKVAEAAGSSLNDSEVLLIVNSEGTKGDVARHRKDVASLAGANKAKATMALEGEKASRPWKIYRAVHQTMLAASPAALQGKASVPISKLGDMLQRVKRIGASQGVEIGVTAQCGSGILYAYLVDGAVKTGRITSELKQAAASLGGFFLIESAPLSFRKELTTPPPRDDYEIMKRLKAEFDPKNILNPGRTPGGRY